jgi:uncharacterized protein (DUF3084 family)
MLTFGIRTILILILIAGAVALIGDYIGRSIGRKRLTLFKLRPRNTAAIFTIITGILIALTTLGILLAVSQDTRTALFGLEELRRDLRDKGAELSKIIDEKNEKEKELEQKIVEKEKIDRELSKAQANLNQSKLEISILRKTREKLSQQIEISRKGKVLFKVDEVLLVSIIQAGPEKEKLETGLKQILSAADAYVRSFGVEKKKHLILILPKDFNQTISDLQMRRGETIIKVIATRNTLFGEEVPVRFALSENRLIFKAGEIIAEETIPPSLSIPEIEQGIKKLLSDAHLAAKEAGVIPDPAGSVGSIPYSDIFSLAKKIKAHKGGVLLKASAKRKVYTMGPLEIKFKVYYL